MPSLTDTNDHLSLASHFLLKNPAYFSSSSVFQCESLDSRGRIITSLQTIFSCTKLVSAKAMAQLVQFIYIGRINLPLADIRELKQVMHDKVWSSLQIRLTLSTSSIQAAEFLNIPELYKYLLSNDVGGPASSEENARVPRSHG